MRALIALAVLALVGCSDDDKKAPAPEIQEDVSTNMIIVTSESLGDEIEGVYERIQTAFFNDTDVDVTDVTCKFSTTYGTSYEIVRPDSFDIISGATSYNTIDYFIARSDGSVSRMDWECDYKSGIEERRMSGSFDY